MQLFWTSILVAFSLNPSEKLEVIATDAISYHIYLFTIHKSSTTTYKYILGRARPLNQRLWPWIQFTYTYEVGTHTLLKLLLRIIKVKCQHKILLQILFVHPFTFSHVFYINVNQRRQTNMHSVPKWDAYWIMGLCSFTSVFCDTKMSELLVYY